METGKIIRAFMGEGAKPAAADAAPRTLAPLLGEATRALLAEVDRVKAGGPGEPVERAQLLALQKACAELLATAAAEPAPGRLDPLPWAALRQAFGMPAAAPAVRPEIPSPQPAAPAAADDPLADRLAGAMRQISDLMR